jgi:inner membrane transporter RhtA
MTGTTPTLRRGLATMLASALSSQVGAATGAQAFPAVGPAGVVAVRQLVAAAVLLPVARPPLRRMTWSQWWPAVLLALVFGTMNLSLYTAVDRVGLGLAVTLEFLGPLAVALAGSRTRWDLVTAGAAAVGVYVLVLPGPSSDWVGLGCGLVAAACWAAYIVLNRVAGARLPGLQASAVATSLSALAYAPVVVLLVSQGRLTGLTLLYAVTAGVLSSVIPYAADLTALRHVPQRFFGVFMSVHPVLAALVGLVLLGQVLALHEWAGIAVVVLANVAAVVTSGRRRRAVGLVDGVAGQQRPVAPVDQVAELQAHRLGQGLGQQRGRGADQQGREGQAELVHQAGREQAREQARPALAEQPAQPAVVQGVDRAREVDLVVPGDDDVCDLADRAPGLGRGGGAGDHDRAGAAAEAPV